MGLCVSAKVRNRVAAAASKPWAPMDDDGDSSWVGDMDTYMKNMQMDFNDTNIHGGQSKYKETTTAETNLIQLGLTDPNFHKDTDLEGGPMSSRRKQMWRAFRKQLAAASMKDNEAHLKALRKASETTAADILEKQLASRQMPGCDELARKIGQSVLEDSPYLQMRVEQWIKVYKENQATVPESAPVAAE